MPLVARVISSALFNTACNLRVYALQKYIRSPLLPRFIQSRPLSFRIFLWNTRARIVPWRPRHFVKSIPRILRKRDRGAEREISSEQILVRGYIFTNAPPSTTSAFFPPSSFSLFLLEHFPIPSLFLSLSLSRPPQTLVSTPFFFFCFFLSPSSLSDSLSKRCDNVLRVTKLYSLRKKEKLRRTNT